MSRLREFIAFRALIALLKETEQLHLLEETYEVLEALDAEDWEALREELGDLLLQVVLHSQIAIDEGNFTMAEVLAGINAKIIRRHPHVWGDVEVKTTQDLGRVWEAQKQQEKPAAKPEATSRLDAVPRALPALQQAVKYQKKAAQVGFDWPEVAPVLAKVHEEIGEVEHAPDEAARARELGDLLFAVVNWARWLGVDPETALRQTNRRFRDRFHYIEQQAASRGLALEQLSLAEMDAWWDEAKRQEK
ncbi:MAG: nucleoside triphosphate pyrophosphohydrolase [Anaerolineae bacterium]|nr:nucleoside triphosphate pyrophosphohydrolase [Anaerolineae bacterium]